MSPDLVTKDLVLVGGGHAHVHVLKDFGMRPMQGVRVTLVTRDVETPYSGMLPGLIAGHYHHDECHIDLRRLARFAGARLIRDEAVGLDRSARRVLCRSHPPVRYDLLSLDIGSTPQLDVPGAVDHVTPVKPIDGLVGRWERLIERIRSADAPLQVVVVGAGAGGVEIALAAQHRLRKLLDDDGRRDPPPRFALVTRGVLLPRHSSHVRAAFRRALAERTITLHERAKVVRVEKGAMLCADGRRIGFDEALWVTDAAAAQWLAETGLECDGNGFVAVDATLRSIGDPLVFAAGDVAAVLPHPREKAGVFAVRQGRPLAVNLRRVLAGRPPRPFRPQRRALALISTGDRRAVASRGAFAAEGAWLWRVKDRIDRRWMRQYQDLPAVMKPMADPVDESAGGATTARSADAMRCGGCGAKVASSVLARVVQRLAPDAGDVVAIGLKAPDDSAVIRPPRDRLLLQTVDFFRAFVEDPHLFGRIAANHALGDIYAMGGAPLTALAIVCVPPGREEIVEDDLFQMLRGGLDVLEAAGARLVGGHSAEGREQALGFAVTGDVPPHGILRKGGLRPGDHLILTKPLGTGTLLAAEMRAMAKARWIDAALESMSRPAGDAAACLIAHGATACTDVTGFGLLGHLLEMLRASNVGTKLDLDSVPALDGALATLSAGLVSTLHPSNAEAGRFLAGAEAATGNPRLPLLFDPQTAGGLLAGVPADRSEACIAALHALGYRAAVRIGVVEAGHAPEPRVWLDVEPDRPVVAARGFAAAAAGARDR